MDLLGINSSQPGSSGTSPAPSGTTSFPEPPGGYGLNAAPPIQGYPPSFETGPSPAEMAAAEQQRQRNQQMMMDSMQNFSNQLANMQRSTVPPPNTVTPAPRVQPGYTPPVMAPYGQPATRVPATGVQPPAPGRVAVAQEPLATEAEKQALTREIENLYVSKWKKHWCSPKNWSGCSIAPSGAKDGLVWRVVNATKKSHLSSIRSTLYCWDPCIVGNLNDSQRFACQKRCDQQFGY
jgi:hypothetical protein